MRIPFGLAIAASGLLAASATAQTAPPAPPPPPPGGGMMRADANHDGVVTRAEMITEASERAGKRFDRMDINHDGRLDATELAAMRPMRGSRGGDMPPPPADPAQ